MTPSHNPHPSLFPKIAKTPLGLAATLVLLSSQAQAATYADTTGVTKWEVPANWDTLRVPGDDGAGELEQQNIIILYDSQVVFDADTWTYLDNNSLLHSSTEYRGGLRLLMGESNSGGANGSHSLTFDHGPGNLVNFTTTGGQAIGSRAGKIGTLNMLSGSVNVGGSSFTIGGAGDGTLNINGGEFIAGRSAPDLGTSAGTGVLNISGGSFTSRAGLNLGAMGTLNVIGSVSTQIGLGSAGTNDGVWTHAAGGVLSVEIDFGGLTPIFVDDVGTGLQSATFDAGAILNVDYYSGFVGGGTWTVLELENGDIVDNGLAFAPGVDTEIWSFAIDNTGTNGLLTVTSSDAPSTISDAYWDGSDDTLWENPLNWTNNFGAFDQSYVHIDSGTVDYSASSDAGINLRGFRMTAGTLNISGGELKANALSSAYSQMDGAINQTGGSFDVNALELGRGSSSNAAYTLSDGTLKIGRAKNGYSLYLGGNSNFSNSGSGTLTISGGQFTSRTGIKLGDATATGTGKFVVLGANASEINIAGANDDSDGFWEQNNSSILEVGIDSVGVTPIFITDSDTNTSGTYAIFENGSLLDVDYYNIPEGGGTWTVMEVENGDITDNGLAFAPGVDTDLWSFAIDNSGANGVLTVSATGAPYVDPNALAITVGNTLKQQMRYGLDYERLWFWSGTDEEKDRYAAWSVADCDVDYIRVAINSKYELTEGTYEEASAYFADNGNDSIIPMMQDMKDAYPDLKFFASPRPLNEAISGVAWQPYPQWVTGSTGTSSNFDFDDIKCAEYLVRYLLLMKHHGFKISYLDVTNEWQSNIAGGRATQTDVRDIHIYLNETYFDTSVNSSPHSTQVFGPWAHPDYPGVTLTPEDIPQIVASSSWAYDEATSWNNNLNTQAKKDAVEIASAHNTDKGGTAQDFADSVAAFCNPGTEIWNTEVHGWKSTSNADEVLTYAYMLECINAGFSGLNGWLAIGFSNQGHCYIVNKARSVKYYMFQKLSNTSNRGFALDVNEPDEFKVYWDPDPDQADADSAVSALIRGNLMTVWVLNHSDKDYLTTITPTGRTISDEPIKFTRWSQIDGLAVEGEKGSIPTASNAFVYTNIQDNSAYCFEILLEPESVPYARIEAESYDGSNPVNHSTEACSDTDGGLNLSNINTGNWTRYDGVDLDHATNIRLRIAADTGRPDGFVEIRTGSETGTLIGSVAVPETDGWQNWQTIETPLAPTAGTHDLYLKYVLAASNQDGTGSMFNLNWFELAGTETPSSVVEAPVSDTQVTLTWNSVPGAVGYTVKRSTTQGSGYITLDDTITETTYTDSDLTPGVTYYYVIVARYGNGEESEASDEIIAVPSNPIVVEELNFEAPSMDVSGDSVGVELLNSEPGHLYQAQEKKALTDQDWLNVGDPIPGNNGPIEFSFPVGPTDTHSFYRITIIRQ